MGATKPRMRLTRTEAAIVGVILTLVAIIPVGYWRYQAGVERARALAAERIAQRAAEAAAFEADRARLAREAERIRDRERVRQLHDEIDALTQRDQKLIEAARKPYANLDDKLERTAGKRP